MATPLFPLVPEKRKRRWQPLGETGVVQVEMRQRPCRSPPPGALAMWEGQPAAGAENEVANQLFLPPPPLGVDEKQVVAIVVSRPASLSYSTIDVQIYVL
uniref:Uncharacterized protein n=1 Tax=Oryza meridionalis TaxID=40149 RepID=A0A0E0C9S4_9ORYZ